MKIALFLGALNQGGLESLMLDICKRYESLPFDMICVYRKEGNYSEVFHNTGARLIKIQNNCSLLYLIKLRKLVAKEKIDIIHAQTPSNALVSILCSLGTKVRIVTTFHGFSFAESSKIYRWIVYKYSQKIVCVSEYEKQYYVNAWKLSQKNKIVVIYNGIDFNKFQSNSVINDPNPFVSISKHKMRLVMVGNFVKGRSPMVVIRAIHILKERGIDNFDFFFVGRRVMNDAGRYDECVKYCEEHSLDNVHFLGGRTDVPGLLKQMDGFVYSSDHDTFGIAVIEALASGLPVIVNDWPVMKEICGVRGENEFPTLPSFFKTGNSEMCADKIKEFLSHRDSYVQQMIEISIDIQKKYSIQNHIHKLEKLYLELI